MTTQPAELIVTKGDPAFDPITGTKLPRVTDTDSVLFQNSGDGQFYFLVAGRWFRAGSLDGPWSAASRNLPPDFARIPDTDPAAFVKASVPGTREAQDAVFLASVPATTTVFMTNPPVQVIYNGPPQFQRSKELPSNTPSIRRTRCSWWTTNIIAATRVSGSPAPRPRSLGLSYKSPAGYLHHPAVQPSVQRDLRHGPKLYANQRGL